MAFRVEPAAPSLWYLPIITGKKQKTIRIVLLRFYNLLPLQILKTLLWKWRICPTKKKEPLHSVQSSPSAGNPSLSFVPKRNSPSGIKTISSGSFLSTVNKEGCVFCGNKICLNECSANRTT